MMTECGEIRIRFPDYLLDIAITYSHALSQYRPDLPAYLLTVYAGVGLCQVLPRCDKTLEASRSL